MTKNAGVRVAVATIVGLAGSFLYGQSVISARSGLVHYVEGDVFIGDRAIEPSSTVFTDVVKDNEVLRTEEGRAEVLLTPGVFLRLAENSSFRMVSSKLSATKVEAVSGSVLLEVGELLKDNSIALVYKDQTIEIAKSGLYRIDAEKGTLRVYNGEAVVTRGASTFTVKQAKMVNLGGSVLTASSFDNKVGDEFFRWASRRASYLSMANMASAKMMHDSGMSLSGSQWAYNPWYNMYTYLPYRGIYNSPFGFGFYSPYGINDYYPGSYGSNWGGYAGGGSVGSANSTHYDSNLGYNVGSRSSGMASAPSSGAGWSGGGSTGGSAGGGSTGGAASAGSARGGDSGGGRGSSSGGGGRGH